MRQFRRQAVLRKMAAMRAAKERRRLASEPAEEPFRGRIVRYPFLEFGVRDTRNGDTAWMPLDSVRDAARRLAVVAKYYR